MDDTTSADTSSHIRPQRMLPAPLPLEPLLQSTEAMSDSFSWRMPSSPVGWSEYHKLLEDVVPKELRASEQRNSVDEASFPSGSDLERQLSWPNVTSDPLNNAPNLPCGPSKVGYMSKDSPFSLDMLPPDVSFLEWFPKGTATITYTNELGDMESISNLSPWIIEERSPLLAQAFEDGLSGPQLHLEPLTPMSARPFLQYLYTGGYSLPTATGQPFHDVPTSLLIHCQLYRLADIYDLPELVRMANLNIIRQCEFACSSPEKPIDLCLAVEYVYKHMREHAGVIDTITNYCVTCFLSHGLGDDFEFRRLAFDLRPFHQELCKVIMQRQFEDESTAQAIIQMPFKPYVPDETYASREDGFGRHTREDVVWHFHGEDTFDSSARKRKMSQKGQVPDVGGLLLALRAKNKVKSPEQDEVTSEKKQRSISPRPDNHQVSSDFNAFAAALWQASAESVDSEEDVAQPSQDCGAKSDSEYEVVAGPAPVETLSSDSDSDAETLILVEMPVSNSSETTLPFRNRTERRDSSDSEWDLI